MQPDNRRNKPQQPEESKKTISFKQLRNQSKNNQNENEPNEQQIGVELQNPDMELRKIQNIELRQPSNHNLDQEEEEVNHLNVYTITEQRQFIFQGLLCILGGIALHLIIGMLRVWGCILPYVASYYKHQNDNITTSQMALTFPFMILGFTSVSTFGMKIAERVGYKTMIFISSLSISLSFIIASFLTNIWLFIAVISLLLGLPSGLVYMLPIIAAWRYFPENRRVVSFIILGAQGFGTCLFNLIAQYLINPEKSEQTIHFIEDGVIVRYFDESIALKIPFLFRIFAFLCAILGITATIFVKYPDKVLEQKQQYQKRAIGYYPTVAHSECDSLYQGIKSAPFFICVAMIWSSCQLNMLISNTYKIYGMNIGFKDYELTIIGSLAFLIAASLKIVWEIFEGRANYKTTIAINASLGVILSIGFALKWNYLALVIFASISEAGFLTTFPIITSKIWGEKIGPIVYGILFSFVGFSNLTIYIIWKSFFSLYSSDIFFYCLATQILTIVSALFLPLKYEWKKND